MIKTFSAFTSDLKKRPELLEQMKRNAGPTADVTTVGILTIVTATTAAEYNL